MPTVSTGARYFSQLLLMAGVVLLSVQSAAAQSQPASGTPESVVLVLKLVSSTHVRPTTGVVISNDGMVLVPADFVAAGDEIVIMQGGTDIIRNGRPSRTVKRSAADGLAVLAVERLNGPAIILSEDRLLQDHVYHMAAFPPADKMAQGAQPLWVPVKLTKNNSTGGFTISTDTPLPDTTGPIIDHCGYLVGLNLAEGEDPVVVLGDELSVIFDSMQIELQSSTCRTPAQKEMIPADSANEEPSDSAEQKNAEDETNKTSEPTVKSAPAIASKAKNSPSVLDIIPNWLWVLGAAILVALLAKLIFFLRTTKHQPQQTIEEPATAPLNTTSNFATTSPGIQPADKDEIPDVNTLPGGFNGIVVIEGMLGDDTPFRHFCMVNTKNIDVVIGRGDVDIRIETPAVSRHHVRLKSAGESLTISDLGSSNGTFIRGIPCLSKEIMVIEPQDEILLGDVRFHINIQVGNIQAGNVQTRHGDPK